MWCGKMPVTYAMLSPQPRFCHSLVMTVNPADTVVKEELVSSTTKGTMRE